jgi:hypothetical protein
MDYLDEVVANIDFSSTNEEISGIKTFSVLPRSTVMPVTEDELTNKSYVDHGVENCASKEYVDTAISNIKIPEVDGYATTEYVDNAIANIDIPEETTETVIFSSADTKEQRKAKFFHLVNLYDSGKKFNAFFKCNAGVSVLGTSFKPDMPTYGFLYSLSFARGGSYNYKYSMSFLVKYIDGSMQSVGDGFAKIELFSKSNDPTQDYNEQCVNVSDSACYYLPRKNELITKTYVDNAVTTLGEHIDEQLANLDISDAPKSAIYQINTEKYLSVPSTCKNADLLATIGEAFTKYFNGETGIPTFRITANDPMCLNPDYLFDLNLLNGLSATYYATRIQKQYSSDAPKLYIVRMTFTLTETDGVYSTSSVDLAYTSQGEKILTTTNTESYTPTSWYHPATKQYVDDSIAAIDIPAGSSNAIEQVETLPKGSEELVGTVYQYIGKTDITYGHIHGNYYVCTKKTYLNKHNDRKTSYPWVNTQYEDIIEEIPMHEYRNTSDVKFLTPGEHQVWGGTTFDVASDLSKILKRYTSDYNSCLFLYSERLTSDTQEYASVLFTVSYNTTIDNVQYLVLEGITHSIKNPGKTAHVILRTAINGFNDYSCSPVFIVTEQGGANLDNYYTKEEVDAAIAAAITGALEGEY